jgi:hypothetical protein
VETGCSLEQKLAAFDSARWSVTCRHMQLRLIAGNVEAAVSALRSFAGSSSYEPASSASPLSAVLPVRIANALEDCGYLNVASVARASDAELARVPNVSVASIALIRRVVQQVADGTAIELSDEDEELVDAELLYPATAAAELESRLLSRLRSDQPLLTHQPTTLNQQPTTTMTNAEQVLSALDTLSGSPDTALEVIDAKITTLEAEIAKYRRLRKMLGGSPATPRTAPVRKPETKEAYMKLGDAMAAILAQRGPLKASAIAQEMADGTTMIAVGKAVTADHQRFIRRTDGLIELRS